MTPIQQAAQDYITQGWAVVPLTEGKKASTSWTKRTYAPKDFGANDNIGGKCGAPSGDRVDVDLDCREAVIAAKYVLPPTLTHGRPGKPDSHWWYLCPGIKTMQFTGVKDDAGKTPMLLELRSTGAYTMIPPSLHPDNPTEWLTWGPLRDPLRMAEADLTLAGRDTAILTLMQYFWTGAGATHAMVGPLAGLLLQGKVDPAQVVRLLTWGAEIMGSDVRDVANYATSTVAKFKAGEKVTGGPTLASLIGQVYVDKLRSWLQLQDLDKLEWMNERHFFTRLGRDSVIGREDRPGVFQTSKALYTEYANQKVVVGHKDDGQALVRPLFPTWLEWSRRRSYREVVFAPPPEAFDPQDYNLWRGFAVSPDPSGDSELFLAHVHDVVCSGNDEHFFYLLNWMAHLVQRPGEQPGVAIALRGLPGTGKGMFARSLSRLFGPHAVHLDNVKHLVGGFNAAISAKVLVFADEAYWAGNKSNLGALKRLITEPTITVERKGYDAVQEKNCVHLILATNEEQSINAQFKERRYLALQVSPQHAGHHAYFDKLNEQLKAGGLGGLLHTLLHHPLDLTLIKKVPKTQELSVQQSKSLKPHEEWWQDCLYEGRVGPLKWTATWVPAEHFYDTYKIWTQVRRVPLLSKVEFGRQLGEYFSAQASKGKWMNGEKHRCYHLRPLDEARKFFDKEADTPRNWPSDEDDGPI